MKSINTFTSDLSELSSDPSHQCLSMRFSNSFTDISPDLFETSKCLTDFRPFMIMSFTNRPELLYRASLRKVRSVAFLGHKFDTIVIKPILANVRVVNT